MDEVKFLNVGVSITKDDIIEFEAKFNVKLPGDFISHYLVFNGGYPEKRYYRWANNEGYTRINCFSSIKYEQYNTIDNAYEDSVLDSYLPNGILPFATDDGGNTFCISTREKDYGFVYYCNNDDYNDLDKEECLTLLTKSFTEFLDSLVDK